MLNVTEIKQGFHYFIMGWHLLSEKGLKRFAIMPILLNILLLGGLFWLFVSAISKYIEIVMSYIPSWLDWLSGILLALSILMILTLFYFIFVTLSGFIAAPFNGLLAEKVEKKLTGEELIDTNLSDFVKDIPRMLGRELQKLLYSLPRIILLFLLGFIPVIGQSIIPVLAFLFTVWMMAIQYCDYPFDNHKISFPVMKAELASKRTLNITFGSLVTLCTFIPLVNLLIIPVAVCGATAMWVGEYREGFNFNIKKKDKNQGSSIVTANKEIKIDNFTVLK